MTPQLTRRQALGSIAAAVALGGVSSKRASADSPNEKLNLACIGVGGRGSANVGGLDSQNFLAFVDVDESRAGKTYEKYSQVPRFVDYRVMLDKIGHKLDGVVISTPDHTHFHPSLAAMQLGLHVYQEKPLAHNVWETRTLTDLASKNKLATQLGVQRHTIPNMARIVEIIQAGLIGNVTEIHSWIGGDRGMPSVPTSNPEIPAGLNYDLWLGPVAGRAYHPSICPYGWRFWWDFGTGETGNFGCHILDIPFWSLGLKYPTTVSATGPEIDAERTPKSMHCIYEFPESNQGSPITLHWYHGTPEIIKEKNLPEKGNNTLFIGEKGMLLCGFDKRQLLPADKFEDVKLPEQSIPKSPGFHREWINACKGETPATCHFDYSGPLTETVLLGNVAYRAGKFDWDYKTLSTGDNQKAQALIQEQYRPGWEM